HVDPETAGQDGGRNGGAQDRIFAEIVLSEVILDRGSLLRIEQVSVAGRFVSRTDGGQLLKEGPCYVVQTHRWFPRAHPADRGGEMHYGIVAAWARTVAGGAGGNQTRALRHLFRRGHFHKPDLPIGGVREASFGQGEFGFNVGPVLAYQEV